MEVRRILKVLWAKWWMIALVAIVGSVAGLVLANKHNDSIRPRWRAQAPVTFFQLDEAGDAKASDGRSGSGNSGATSTVTEVDVDAERARAQLLLEDTLTENPRLSVQIDRAANLLLFVAVGRDGAETLDQALSLRDQYQAVGATILSIDQIEATMASLLVDIDRLKQEIAALEVPEPVAEDATIAAQRTALEAEIASINQRQAQLRIWVSNPELRPTETDFRNAEPEVSRGTSQSSDATTDEEPVIVTEEEIEAEKATNALVLARLQIDLARLPDPPVVAELDGKTTLELEALNLDLSELEAQYIDLLRRRDGRPPGGFFEAAAVTDETPTERSVALFGFIGFLASALMAAGGLIGLDRARRPVWSTKDLGDIVSLGIVHRDRTDGPGEGVWYPASLSQRRRDIQTLRAAVDAVTEEQSAIVGFFGMGVSGEEVGEMAGDLAAAYTVAERDVLLIDGNAFHPNTIPEFGEHTAGLNDTLMTQMPQADAIASITRLLDRTPEVMPCLTSIGVDGGKHDPIDAFASPNCRVLMDVAKAKYDVVVVAGPDVADPLSEAVVRRVDHVVLVGYVGYTTITQIATAADVLADRRAALAGVVLLEGRRERIVSKVRTWAHGSAEPSTSTESAEAATTEMAPPGNDAAPAAATSGSSPEAAAAVGQVPTKRKPKSKSVVVPRGAAIAPGGKTRKVATPGKSDADEDPRQPRRATETGPETEAGPSTDPGSAENGSKPNALVARAANSGLPRPTSKSPKRKPADGKKG